MGWGALGVLSAPKSTAVHIRCPSIFPLVSLIVFWMKDTLLSAMSTALSDDYIESEAEHDKNAANRSVLAAFVLRVFRFMGHISGPRLAGRNGGFQRGLLRRAMPA